MITSEQKKAILGTVGFIIGVGALLIAPLGFVRAQSVRLPISFHRQEHSLSCEVAALKMALGSVGVSVSESQLIAQLPFDRTPKAGGVWGDPNKGFVGSIDGRMLVTGYGVHWDPIAALGKKYGQTEIIQHGSAQQLAQHVAAGHPVIIWGYYGQRKAYSWQTPSGTPVKAINGEHTMVVYGFDGTAQSPTRFYLMDPLIGSFSWSTAELMHNWSGLEHMGVVVSPPLKWVRLPNDTQVWEISADGTTRHLVSTWTVFERRGGTAGDIQTIDTAKLLRYKLGLPIT